MSQSEKWKAIKGYKGRYIVSNYGNVCYLSGSTWYVKAQSSASSKYNKVVLFKDGKRHSHWVHRLVAEAFIRNKENKPQIDHINSIRTDNRACNLRWATAKENSNNPITSLRRKIARVSGITYSDTQKYITPPIPPGIPPHPWPPSGREYPDPTGKWGQTVLSEK